MNGSNNASERENPNKTIHKTLNNCKNKNIEFTKKNSEQNLYKIANDCDYIANKNIKWGYAKLIKNFEQNLEI